MDILSTEEFFDVYGNQDGSLRSLSGGPDCYTPRIRSNMTPPISSNMSPPICSNISSPISSHMTPPISSNMTRPNSSELKRKRWWIMIKCKLIAALGGLIVGEVTTMAGGMMVHPGYLAHISQDIFKYKPLSQDTGKKFPTFGAKLNRDIFCVEVNQNVLLFSSLVQFMVVVGIMGSALFDRRGKLVLIPCGRPRRRSSLFIAGTLLFLGFALTVWFLNLAMEITGLALIGLGAGILNKTVLAIYSEMVPKGTKSKIVEWSARFGAVVGHGLNYLGVFIGVNGWRVSISVLAIPTFIILMLARRLIESPKFLIEHGFLEKAKYSLQATREPDVVDTEFSDIVATVDKFARINPVIALIQPRNRPMLIIKSIQTIYVKILGMDLFSYYTPFILKSSCYTTSEAYIASLILSSGQTLGSIFGTIVIACGGRRRPLFLLAHAASAITLVILGVLFFSDSNQTNRLNPNNVNVALASILVHSFSTGIVSGPYQWLEPNYPEECVEFALTYHICLSLLTTIVGNQFFLRMLCRLKQWTFFLYAMASIMLGLFTHYFIPETTRVKQEEMVTVWNHHRFWRRYTEQDESNTNRA